MIPTSPVRGLDASEFVEAFVKGVDDALDDLAPYWTRESNNLRPYTETVLQNLLPAVANRFGLKSYCSDYYTLDAVFYHEDDLDKKNFSVQSTYFRRLRVAIEHENQISSAHEEICKLLLFSAKLKVLIVYGTAEESELSLKKWSDMITTADDPGVHNFLVAIGSPNGQMRWSFYHHDGVRFACSGKYELKENQSNLSLVSA